MPNNYVNYQSMVTSVTTGISRLDDVYRHLSMEAQADELGKISDRLQQHIFSVGIMGEFKRGKSTVINAMLGSSIVPADIMPCSATLNYIKWDTTKHAEVRFKDGSKKTVSVEELSGYITKITEESERQAESVEDATVYYPCSFCQNGVQIIDTPGLNDDERMNVISESVIPTLDAIIMVTVPGSPFGISEAEFVRNKVMTSDLGRIIFVVNKIDTVDEEDRDRILQYIKSKIKSSVLEKMKAIYGESSEEYKNARDKLAGIRILGVSAKQALKGKQKNDPQLLAESVYPEFEAMLSRLLTEERGLLELIHPVNQIISTAQTSLETIDTRVNALKLDAEEFDKAQKEAIEKITEMRGRKKEEIELLKSKGNTLYVDLLPELEAAYNEIDTDVSNYVNQLPITAEDIRDKNALDAFTQKVSGQIQQKVEDTFSVAAEKLMHKVDEQLGEDMEALEKFGRDFNCTIRNVNFSFNADFSGGGNDLGKTVRDSLIDAATLVGTTALTGGASCIPGVGGIIAGWRNHGAKGAVVGGLSGLGISFASALLLGPLGIVGIPFALITGAASAFGGRAVTDLIFGRKKESLSPEAVRRSIAHSTEEAVLQMKADKVLESWLKSYCENAYASVADNIDEEWENTLVTLEGSLSQIKLDIQMNEANKKKLEETMEEYAATVKAVLAEVDPIRKKLTAALNAN